MQELLVDLFGGRKLTILEAFIQRIHKRFLTVFTGSCLKLYGFHNTCGFLDIFPAVADFTEGFQLDPFVFPFVENHQRLSRLQSYGHILHYAEMLS
jgi:hypothetical protein